MPKRFRKGIQVISYTPKIDYHKTKKDNYHWFSQYTLQILYRLTKKTPTSTISQRQLILCIVTYAHL